MKCFRCGCDMVWGGDHDYEDYGIDEESGVVSNLSCQECSSFCIFYMPTDCGIDAKDEKGVQDSV